MINPTMILAIAAVVGPVLAWGLTTVKADWIDIPFAVAAAKEESVKACNGRVLAIQTEMQNKTTELTQRAEAAERAMAPTPAEAAELQDLCDRSASCRSRRKK